MRFLIVDYVTIFSRKTFIPPVVTARLGSITVNELGTGRNTPLARFPPQKNPSQTPKMFQLSVRDEKNSTHG